MYDIIGDIHGHATPLKNLLAKMGYAKIDGVWQHPARQAVFLGDFVDRGPEQVETVLLVKEMVTRGFALSVMGNHELNAIAWVTPDPNPDGLDLNEPSVFMRPHHEKNRHQHSQFLNQVGEGSTLHHEMISWFKTLPLYLELERFRVVHACWHAPSIDTINSLTDAKQRVLPHQWVSLLRKGTNAFEAGETTLKGLEVELPKGYEFLDKDKHPRRHVRAQWWVNNMKSFTYRDIAIVPPDVLEKIPHSPVPGDVMPGYLGDKVLFVGHYWRTGTPAPLSDHVACLDYSIAAENIASDHQQGKLCAYRYNGEARLTQDAFIWV